MVWYGTLGRVEFHLFHFQYVSIGQTANVATELAKLVADMREVNTESVGI